MGGRGSYSASSIFSLGRKTKTYPLAVAQMNTGNAKGTSEQLAIERWRSNTLREVYEYGGWIDSQGYVHAMTTDKNRGSVHLADYNKVQRHQRNNMVATIHNHPSDAKRGYGGTFSASDILSQNHDFLVSNGKTKTAYATAREGIYKATFTKHVNNRSLTRTLKNIDRKWRSQKYTSRKKMWDKIHTLMRNNLKRYGISIELIPSSGRPNKLVAPELK